VKIWKRFALISAILVGTASGSTSAGPITGLFYTSSPSSSVGLGESLNLDLSTALFSVEPSLTGGDFDVLIFGPLGLFTRTWILSLAAPFGQKLAVGHYSDAMQFPFEEPGFPGLNFAIDGRSSRQLTGNFDVLEVSFANFTFQSLAVDFVQFDDASMQEWVRGSFRLNSDIPLRTAPEPSSMMLNITGLALLLLLRPARKGTIAARRLARI